MPRLFLGFVMLGLALPVDLAAETACFRIETKTMTSHLTLDLPDGDGPMAAWVSGTVHDEEEGYFTSWESEATGTRRGDRLTVQVETAIEDDRQTEREQWRLDGGGVDTPLGWYEPVACEGAESGYDAVPDHAEDMAGAQHCGPDQIIVLGCTLADGEAVLSVCLADDGSRLAVWQGAPGGGATPFPGDGSAGFRQFRLHTLTYSGGFDTRLGFGSDGTAVHVYERLISKGPGREADYEAGMLVFEGRELVGELPCLPDTLVATEGGLGLLGGKVREEAFFDEKGPLR